MENQSPQTEAQRQAEAIRMRRVHDFARVFGIPPNRSPSQTRVLDYLEQFANDELNTYDFNQPGDGLRVIAAGIHRDGAKSLLRVIKRNLQAASTQATEPKPEVKAKR